MNFRDANALPIEISWGDRTIQLPRFTRGDWKKMASKMDKARVDRACAGLNQHQRVEKLLTYNIPGTTFDELNIVARSIEGAEFIVATCFRKPETLRQLGWEGKSEDEINELIEPFFDANDEADIIHLAYILGSRVELKPPSNKADEPDPLKEVDDNPLAGD